MKAVSHSPGPAGDGKRLRPGVAAPLLMLLACWNTSIKCPGAALSHDVYIWQRTWTEPVRRSLQQRGTNFSTVVPLRAEISWDKGIPRLARASIEWDTLTQLAGGAAPGNGRPRVGLALRIGPYSGPFSTDDTAGQFVLNTARDIVREAENRKCTLAELQLDFDCAESKLAGYRIWAEAIRREIHPARLVLTALPAWLNRAGFKELAGAADGFVLQVHSLTPPRNSRAEFTLCDPASARKAVEQAGKLAVPFRVALPTYGYLVAFDPSGRFVGLSAEGPAKEWPAGVEVREITADPAAIAGLVQLWTTNRPSALQGVIWYRFPAPGDNLNWRWPTLEAILSARSPRESFRVESCRVEAGLVEINLVNDGELDISSRLAIEARWQNARLVAADGLRSFEMADAGPSSVIFQNSSRPARVPAGEQVTIAWIRLSEEREVQVECKRLETEKLGRIRSN